MKRFLTAHGTALSLVLVAAAAAPADTITPPDSVWWTYSFKPGAPAVFADNNPGAGVTFTSSSGMARAVLAPGRDSSDINPIGLRVFSAATDTPDMLITNGGYSLTIELATVDNPTLKKSLTFTGKLTGSFSAENSTMANLFGPDSTKSVTLGAYTFTVSLNGYTPPGPPISPNQTVTDPGTIGATVTVSKLTAAQVPEPGTMLLSGLGLTFLGGAAWRKRRRAARPAL